MDRTVTSVWNSVLRREKVLGVLEDRRAWLICVIKALLSFIFMDSVLDRDGVFSSFYHVGMY